MKYLQIIVISILFACKNNTPPVNKTPIIADTVTPIDANTINTQVATSNSFRQPTLESIVHDFVSQSTDTFHIDTLFTFDNAPYRLKVNYYCLFDSALIVPMKFVEIYGMDEFITNNFATDIKLFKDSEEILDTTLSKEDFARMLTGNDAVKYRLLFSPVVAIKPDSVTVSFSLSVPLTDVGEQVGLNVLKKTIKK